LNSILYIIFFIFLILFFIILSIFILYKFLGSIIFKNYKYLTTFFFFSFIFIFLLYFYLNKFNFNNKIYTENITVSKEDKFLARKVTMDLNKQIMLVKQMLVKENNYILWWHLGRLYEIQGIYDKSIQYMKIAYDLNLNDSDLMLNYVLVKAKILKGSLDNQCLNIIDNILFINPYQLEALNLLAINAYKNKDYEIAKKNWKIILENTDNIGLSRLIEDKLIEIN